MPEIKRLPGETREEAKLRIRKEWQAAEPERRRQEEETRRKLCTALTFWKFCGHKQCRRRCACAGDVGKCFHRLWPLVPEEVKVEFRALVTAMAKDKLPQHEAVRHAKAERARYLEMEARFARQKAEQEAEEAQRFAPPQPHYVPEDQAPRVRTIW
jgi:hypothetical protein